MAGAPSQPPPPDRLWRAPLVPVALALTVGIVLDRWLQVPPLFSLALAAAALAAWLGVRYRTTTRLPLLYAGVAIVGLGAAYHHLRRDGVAADDISFWTRDQPVAVVLRGTLLDEPVVTNRTSATTAAAYPWRPASTGLTRLELRPTALLNPHGTLTSVSGKVLVTIPGRAQEVHGGDELEVRGRLVSLKDVGNPGEFDQAGLLRDHGLRARVLATAETVRLVTRPAVPPPGTWPAWVRARARTILLDPALPFTPASRGLTLALLLGDGSAMTPADWERYKRTGVVHALAISGQHLTVLGVFCWFVLSLARVPRRRAALLTALLLIGYALVTGGRPPALRAAVTVAAFCGAIFLRRHASKANTFALSWLAVALINPTDLATPGCQLSFLAVAVLYWGAARWFRWEWFREPDDLDRLEDEARPGWLRALRRLLWWVVQGYLVGALVWLAVVPLLAYHYHLVPLAALVIGPPIALLTSVALITGFVLLLAGSVCWPLAWLAAWPTALTLDLCEGLVRLTDRVPASHFSVGVVPTWWLMTFYVGLLAGLMLESAQRRWRWLLLAGTAWLCLGLAAALQRPGEFRCTFLAVGHGTCVVLETPDGRTLLYDAGSRSQPDVARRQIAPFLRSRGIQRIDEIFISHADIDHFNAVAGLLETFPVGQVSCTPTFHQKSTDAVRQTLAALDARQVPVRVIKAGDRLLAGAVELSVLHPPEEGPEESENARSLVLLVRHEGHRILLTGDLTGAGLRRVLALPLEPIDVMLAPHHGSPRANTLELAAWAQPRWVVSCQGPAGESTASHPYDSVGAEYLTTSAQGAVTVRSHAEYLLVETFR